MNVCDTVKLAYERRIKLSVPSIYLAWLSLHAQQTVTHPDDYLQDYMGWHALLAHDMFNVPNLPDELMYPNFILALPAALIVFKTFHNDDEDTVFVEKITTLQVLLSDLWVENLPTICATLDELVLYHDGAPKDAYEVLCTASGVFAWIKSQN
jgi:hypothetical protein